MRFCTYCGEGVRTVYRGRRLVSVNNSDNQEHKKTCRYRNIQREAAKTRIKRAEIRRRPQTSIQHIKGKAIVGVNYKPIQHFCNRPPWEECGCQDLADLSERYAEALEP